MTNRLLVLTRNPDEYEKTLTAMNLPEIEIYVPKTENEILNMLPKANILLANPPIAKKYINQAINLAWMQSTFAGIDSLVDRSLRMDYLLTNVKETYGEAMSEYVFAYVLMFEREILENLRGQQEHRWNEKPYKTLSNKTIGIMGTGSIGRHIAKVARIFGVKTIGFHTTSDPVEHFDATYSMIISHHFCRQVTIWCRSCLILQTPKI